MQPNRFKQRLDQVTQADTNPTMLLLLILGLILGIIGGLSAVGFLGLIQLMKQIFWGFTPAVTFMETVYALPWYQRLLMPVIGGLIVGPLIVNFVKEARGHGVPFVIAAVENTENRLLLRAVPLKAIIWAVCIGSGGSAGRVGPIIQIGASFGSSLGTLLKFSPDHVRTLLASGVAACLAGMLNAPLAGVFFGVEVLIRERKIRSLFPIIIAAVTGSAIPNLIFDKQLPFSFVPGFQLLSTWELIAYLGLGFFAAGFALLFSNLLFITEDLYNLLPVPDGLKAAIGGLMVGGIALLVPQVLATGYSTMESVLKGQLTPLVIMLLFFAKIIATCITLGSGGSGGIFAPLLFIGIMLGSSYGHLLGVVFPFVSANSSSFALVGMGAMLAGAIHAPLTAIMLVFEITRDPFIIIPLVFACTASYFLALTIQKTNIYTKKLVRLGLETPEKIPFKT